MGASAVETDDAETRSDPICSLASVQKPGKVRRSPGSPQPFEAWDFQPQTLVHYCLLHLTRLSMGLWHTTFASAKQF